MDRSNSLSSTNSSGSLKRTSSAGPFAYQTRLLERTASRGSAGSLSRNNSQSSNSVLNNVTGSSSSSATTRRWTPSHRVGNSLDAVRGKWEERAKAEQLLDNRSSPTRDSSSNTDSLNSRTVYDASTSFAVFESAPPVPPKDDLDQYKTPAYLKRRTMPAPIIASPLSPNNTGLTVETSQSQSFGTSVTQRIRLPAPKSANSTFDTLVRQPTLPDLTSSSSPQTRSSPPSRYRRSNTLDSISPNWNENPKRLETAASLDSSSFAPRSPITSHHRRPTSLYGAPASGPSSPERFGHPPLSLPQVHAAATISNDASQKHVLQNRSPISHSPTSSVMSPTPYRSSYMTNKKALTYGDNLVVGRKLGRHLPRIASGDGDENWELGVKEEENHPVREVKEPNQRSTLASPDKPSQQVLVSPGGPGDDVAGVPGRLRLSRDKTPSAPSSPLPSARLTRGLWADVQRQHLQAYEYLCHVGEAQQWIEMCLDRELGFGVVEMEESLRNGVVLAKLAQVFQGEAVVRKIYEAPKLDFRHSDNINHFFNFVREVGLPEGFIFELTDLYEKKNFPKVIYCIHALSHLLARRGLAERIGNLLGHLNFTEDQLRKTQKGLKDAGVAMPNFNNVGRELAKEINEEEVETEEERRDRLLLENEASILATQCVARGFLIRKEQALRRVRFRIVERYIIKVQAHSRGVLIRRWLKELHRRQTRLTPWVILLQATIRAVLVRQRWRAHTRRLRQSAPYVTKIQAQLRGILQRRRYAFIKAAMRRSRFSVIKLQSLARARITRHSHRQVTKAFAKPKVQVSVVALQAVAGGLLQRRKLARQLSYLKRFEPQIKSLQARCRGVLIRRRIRAQMAKLEDVTHIVVRMQAAVRTYLARKRLLKLIRGLRRATPMVIGFQARARAGLQRRQHKSVVKALSRVEVINAIGQLQARSRAAIKRNRHREQNKRLEFVAPDVVGLQAAARGHLVRQDYFGWRDHLRRSQPVASLLQAMLRGVLQRRRFRAKMAYFRANLRKVVKIQSLFRGKETREQYRQLTLGTNVTVGTIKNFVHLLDDSEADFQEEIKVERLRKRVVGAIRENQALESDVNDLDVKIALVVQNVKSFEELVRARGKHGTDNAAAHAARSSVLAAHGDPFAGTSTLDHAAHRKLELYQQLFYLLQTKGEYLSRLFVRMSQDNVPEKNRRLIERVVLTLFGYGQDHRENYLLLKMFQLSIHEEITSASSIEDVIHGHPMYINIAVHYVRPKQIAYARDTLQAVIREVVDSDDLDLEADPSLIHRARINIEEMRSGIPTSKAKDIPFYQALNDPETRAIYIRHLQTLQWWTEAFVTAITQSTRKMPYGMRYLVRETLFCLRNAFPDASAERYGAAIGRLVYYRYINPAIITPETFDIVSTTIDVASRKNLAQISRILTQIINGCEFSDDNPSYVPINDYVRNSIARMSTWMFEVADIPDAETQFHAHEFLDATVQPKPIYISPNEVYSMHALLSQHLEFLAPSRDDTLRVILQELDGVPNFGNEELKDARDTAVTLELTNRFAHVRDPQAHEKALWVQAKRAVLAILRVQPAQSLLESLMSPVTDADEETWEDVLENELENDNARQISRRQPSAAGGDAAYRLEDIRSMTFKEVKAHAIQSLLELEKQERIDRKDGFQGILNAIAGDVRSKHRKRLQRQQEMESMNIALQHLAERKKNFEEQINSYHDYIDSAMNTMQRGKGKKRFVLPFTKQYFHLRDLQKSGKSPQFGSFKYTAKYLYEKGILLSVDQYSPRQFDKVDLTISSNEAGVFAMELDNHMLGNSTRLASAQLRMEELLQAQYQNQSSLSLFDGMVKVNLNLFLFQINKKFYV